MKTKKWVEPNLFIDSHHGVYMGKIAWQQLSDKYKEQAEKQMSKEDIKAIQDTDNEWYFEACDALMECEFTTETGQKWKLQYAEGGIWAIPCCFLRTKKATEFFGS